MNIAIVGAGGWGTALANLLAVNLHDVVLWSIEADVVDEINQHHSNSAYLPGITIPERVRASCDTADVNKAELIIVATPTQYIASVFRERDFHIHDKIVVSVSKGIEQNSLHRVSQVLQDAAGIDLDRFVALTGPSHAEEVARQVPTTVVAASRDVGVAKLVQQVFTTPFFRVYHSHDVIGAELGGAVKNVIAISAGIIEGLGLGDNTKAALMTRGLAEITRLGKAMGAQALTFSGLSCLGDLFVTCTSKYSRNRAVGEKIGSGQKLDAILAETKMIAEGVATTASVRELSHRYHVEMPIVNQVYAILFENKDAMHATRELMMRETKSEIW